MKFKKFLRVEKLNPLDNQRYRVKKAQQSILSIRKAVVVEGGGMGGGLGNIYIKGYRHGKKIVRQGKKIDSPFKLFIN